MKINLLEQEIRNELKEVLNIFFEQGYIVTLVGGAVRDFHLGKTLSHDLDFEIRHKDTLKDQEWLDSLKKVFNQINEKYPVEILKFAVFRFKYKQFSLEFSSPRIEHYNTQDKGHSNFTTSLSSQLSYSDAFRRRDFTVNAMGLEIHSDRSLLVDPFHGLMAIENKELKPCSPDFHHDPVRFLRSLRFSLNLNFIISEELKLEFKKMDLTQLSSYYFKQELFKSKSPLKFWHQFFMFAESAKIVIPDELKILSEIYPDFDLHYRNMEEWLIGSHFRKPIPFTDFQNFIRYFKLPENRTKSLISFFDQLVIFEIDDYQDLAHQTPAKAIMNTVLMELKDLYQANRGHQFLSEYRPLLLTLIPTKVQHFDELYLGELKGQEEWEDYLSMHDIDKELWVPLKLYFHLKSLPGLKP
jgi:hypothetical protein